MLTLIWDAHRFVLYFKGAIETAPLQVYHSALVFSPTCSLIRGLFQKEKPQWIMKNPVMEGSWSACLQTLEGHSGWVSSVTFSHDSKLLASASWDKTVKVWDASNGQCLQTLEGHSHTANSVTFSHDSKLLASASGDNTVKVWDTSNGQCLQTLEGHSRYVTSVTFSHDSKLLASASWDKTVKVWDANNGQCLQTLEGHSHKADSVTFSHDSKLLASASGDKTVKVWDASNGQCLQTLHIERRVSIKSFDCTNSYLSTDKGTIHLSPSPDEGVAELDPEIPRFQHGISSDDTWITWNSVNLLWLPPEHRPFTYTVALSNICIVCASGRVLIFNFDSQALLDDFAQH